MSESALKIYIRQIHEIEPLAEKEEVDLFRKSKGKGKKAKEARLRLIEVNLPLVITLAKKYYYPSIGMDFLNFIEEGNIGLIKAVEKFDPDKGCKFSHYASWWIEKHFQESILSARSVIPIPEKKLRDLKKIEEATSRLLRESGSVPDYGEVAEKIDKSISEIVDVLMSVKRMKYVKSLDFYMDNDDARTLKDFIEGNDESFFEELLDKISIRKQIENMFSVLDEREKKIITMRFGLDDKGIHTYDEIGKEMGLSAYKVRDIQDVAIRKLKFNLNKKNPEPA